AIEKVCAEAWPRPTNADELHEALLLSGALTEEEIRRTIDQYPEQRTANENPRNFAVIAEPPKPFVDVSLGDRTGASDPDKAPAEHRPWLEELARQRRAGRLKNMPLFWVAAERLPLLQAIYVGADTEPALTPPEFESQRSWERANALRELVRGRMEISG